MVVLQGEVRSTDVGRTSGVAGEPDGAAAALPQFKSLRLQIPAHLRFGCIVGRMGPELCGEVEPKDGLVTCR